MEKPRATILVGNLEQIEDCYLIIQPVEKHHHETFFGVLRGPEKI
jgi:hypothetical protein